MTAQTTRRGLEAINAELAAKGIPVAVTMDLQRRPGGPPPGIVDKFDFAEMAGVSTVAITKYVQRGVAPAPEGHVGGSPWWYESVVVAWVAQRGGRGRWAASRKESVSTRTLPEG